MRQDLLFYSESLEVDLIKKNSYPHSPKHQYPQKTQNDFNNFSNDIILQRAVERDLEIIGEAIRKIIEINPQIEITASKNIIGLRNIISHAYDSVEPEMLWGIIQKNIPVLADEIRKLKGA